MKSDEFGAISQIWTRVYYWIYFCHSKITFIKRDDYVDSDF